MTQEEFDNLETGDIVVHYMAFNNCVVICRRPYSDQNRFEYWVATMAGLPKIYTLTTPSEWHIVRKVSKGG